MTEPLMGDPSGCRVFSADVAVHWYPQGSTLGDSCFCGALVMRDHDADQPSEED